MVFTSRVFLHTPCGVAQPIEKSLGGILCLWNDVNVDDKPRIELHNGMINGMLPFAERFWNGGVVADTTEVKDLNVLPPVKWNEPAKYAFNFNTWHKPEEELPYTDEQFYWMRQPAFIPLRKGENSIKILAPKTFAAQRWTFTFIPLTLHPDGRVSEPRGIKFK